MKRQAGFVCGSAATLAILLLQGCAALIASGTPDWDSRFGDSTRQLRAQQLIDTDAPQRNANARQVTDSRSAREARDRYIESFTAPPPQINMILVAPGGSR